MKKNQRNSISHHVTGWLKLATVSLAILCLVAILLAVAMRSGALLAPLDYSSEGKRWWNDVKFLADDSLEGRMTGSAGYQIAAGYVAQQFKKEDLKTAGKFGYFQPVHFISRELDEPHSQVDLRTKTGISGLQLGAAVILRSIGDSTKQVSAEMVFAGYGMSVPEANYDDLAGLDVKGKIVVYLTGGPDSIPDPLRAHEESLGQRWVAMKAAGAVGMASIPNPALMEVPWSNIAANRNRPVLELADTSLRHDRGLQVDFTINPARAEEFFEGSGHTFAEIIAAAKAKKPLPHFPLVPTLEAKIVTTETKVESPNVVGVLEGSDPKLKKEYIVVSAHLDHLGKGAPVNGDDIYNGAMDNAAGVAALIQIANDFKLAGKKPKRSVLFLAVCGEEEGELGSWYFANHPTVPRDSIVADINMDMFLPLFPLQYLQVQGLDESSLGDDIRAVGQAASVKIIPDEQPQANRFIRSDQYSFGQKGIPALAFKFGYVKGSPEEKIFNDWVHTRYHEPSDDINQHVDKDAAGKFCHLIYMLAGRVANDTERPSWEPTSFFRRFAEEK